MSIMTFEELTKDDIAYVIGNGTTRNGFDLESLRGLGTIIGCNALYRDFEPDYLVAIDDKMIQEIKTSTFPKEKRIFPPEQERWEPKEIWPGMGRPRSNAGMNAIREAIKMDNRIIYCLGFDFLLEDETTRTDNVYVGTNSYGPETHTSAEDSLRRGHYLNWIVENNPGICFVFVFGEEKPYSFSDKYAPSAKDGVWAITPNAFYINYKQLKILLEVHSEIIESSSQ